jgi:hypothetical protein
MTDLSPEKASLKEHSSLDDNFGVDLDLLASNLQLSYEERLAQHHSAYTLMNLFVNIFNCPGGRSNNNILK